MAQIEDTLVVNGANLGLWGLEWSERTDWRSYPAATVLTHELPNTDGLLFQERVENRPRVVTVRGTVAAATMAQLQTYLNEVAARLNGFLELQFSDDPTRFIGGYLESGDVGEFQPGALVPVAPFTFRFRCPDPRRYDVAATSVVQLAGCPLGTARVKPVITITGPATDPTTIVLKDHTGSTVSTFTMAAALSSGEAWLIDAELALVRHDDGAGTISNAMADWSGEFPVLDPEDSEWASSSWPYFEATAGAPASVLIEYKKAWK